MPAPGDYRLLASFTPSGTYSAAGIYYTLGTEFRVDSACTLKGLWYYRPSTATTATPTAAVWSVAAGGASGTLLPGSSVTFAAGSATGWIYKALPTPVTLTPGQSYRVGVYFSNTLFAYDAPFWTTGGGASGVTSGPITAPNHANAVGGRQGPYDNSTGTLTFPATDGNQCYGADVTVTVAAQLAAAALSAGSTLGADAGRTSPAATGLTASSSLTAGPVNVRPGGAALSADSTLTAAGQRVRPAAAALAASSSLVPQVGVVPAVATLAASATLTAAGSQRPKVVGAATLAATATLVATALPNHNYVLGVVVESETAPPLDFEAVLGVVVESETVYPLVIPTPPKRYVPGLPYIPDLRVLAQDIVSGRWLHLDVPVAELSITHTLSGPQAVTGKLRPQIAELMDLGMAPWATWLHVEDDDGLIRASAILQPPFGVEDDTRSVEAAGVSSYPHRQSFDGEFSSYSVDPLDVVRMLWQSVLTSPGARPLGVTVAPTRSTVRIGGYPPATSTGLSGPQIAVGESSGTEVKPYTLSWWEGPNPGETIDTLSKDVPFDYVEQQGWNVDRSAVTHHVDLGWPRAGRLRSDLRFAEGENIRDKIPLRQGEDQYVTDVRVRGAGEGRAKVLGSASRVSPGQLSIVLDIDDPTVKSPARAKSRAEAELARRSVPLSIEKILVNAKDPAAPYGSYSVGDDILVQVEVDWVGELVMWHRIMDHTYTPDEEAVAITLMPSSVFRYGTAD